MVNSDSMPLYDWGSEKLNQEKYGQPTPPHIDFSKINVPTALFVGSDDNLADPQDVWWAKNQMNPETVVHYQEVFAGHASFLIGSDMSYFDEVLELT